MREKKNSKQVLLIYSHINQIKQMEGGWEKKIPRAARATR